MQRKAAVNRLYDIYQDFLGFCWCVTEDFIVCLKLIIWIWLHFLLQYSPEWHIHNQLFHKEHPII